MFGFSGFWPRPLGKTFVPVEQADSQLVLLKAGTWSSTARLRHWWVRGCWRCWGMEAESKSPVPGGVKNIIQVKGGLTLYSFAAANWSQQ